MNNLKDIHNRLIRNSFMFKLFYQDFNEQFEGYTQLFVKTPYVSVGCFIRISMNNLKDIHNAIDTRLITDPVVLSGFQ